MNCAFWMVGIDFLSHCKAGVRSEVVCLSQNVLHGAALWLRLICDCFIVGIYLVGSRVAATYHAKRSIVLQLLV